jgi:SNF2 family DNA or RNA helicase
VDAYGLAKLINPKGVAPFFGQFRDQVMIKITDYRWVPRPEAKAIVRNVLQPAIRFEKKDCLDLPSVTFMDRDAPMTAQQRKYYKTLAKQMLIEAAGEDISAVNAAVKVSKLLQIACGSVYTDTGEVIDFDASERLNVVQEVVDECSNKVLIFVPFSHSIEMVRRHLTKNGVSCEVINGDVNVNKRAEIVQLFQTSTDPKVLIIQPQAASHGLTLTAADTIIWYAPCTSVETYLQANARIDRPGQVNPMTVVHVKGSPVEARMYSLLRSNIRNHNEIIDLYRQEILAAEEEIA